MQPSQSDVSGAHAEKSQSESNAPAGCRSMFQVRQHPDWIERNQFYVGRI